MVAGKKKNRLMNTGSHTDDVWAASSDSYINSDAAHKQLNALNASSYCEILITQTWLSTLNVHNEPVLLAYYHLNKLI